MEEVKSLFTAKEMEELPDKLADVIFGDDPDNKTVAEIGLRTKYIVDALLTTFSSCVRELDEEENK